MSSLILTEIQHQWNLGTVLKRKQSEIAVAWPKILIRALLLRNVAHDRIRWRAEGTVMHHWRCWSESERLLYPKTKPAHSGIQIHVMPALLRHRMQCGYKHILLTHTCWLYTTMHSQRTDLAKGNLCRFTRHGWFSSNHVWRGKPKPSIPIKSSEQANNAYSSCIFILLNKWISRTLQAISIFTLLFLVENDHDGSLHL